MNLDQYTEAQLRQLRADIDARLPKRRPGRPSRKRERARRYEAMLRSEYSLSDIAREVGVTRQAVEQDVPKWLTGLIRQRNQARRRLQEFVHMRECRTCGALTSRPRYCCTEHHEAMLSLRTHLPGIGEQHRRNAALSVLRHPERPSYARNAALARQIVAGTAPPKNRRYMAPGSLADIAAREAYRNGWPIFNELPEEIRNRIITTTTQEATP